MTARAKPGRSPRSLARRRAAAAERKLAPNLVEIAHELKMFWAGDAVADGARHEFALLVQAVLAAAETTPDCCYGYSLKTKRCSCRLHRALERLGWKYGRSRA